MRHFLFAAFSLLFLFQSVSGHNWLTSPARGNKFDNFNGFTSPPCPAKGNRVHVQVGPGDKFPIEWASGHGYGSFTFLVVMKASDEPDMIKNTFELLNDYLANAPASALQYMSNDKAVHVCPNGACSEASLDRDITATWNRPAVFRKFPNARVYSKKATATANDRRARYNNAKYPWIISVHKFALNEDKPEDMDSAMVEIPSDLPSGQYVVQYLWDGYYDCTDVNFLTVPSTDKWGSAAPASTIGYDKIDHCQYNQTMNNFRVFDCVALAAGETIDNCAARCSNRNGQYDGCNGVVVTPATLPASAKFRGRFNQNGQQSSTYTHLPRECDAAYKAMSAAELATNSLCYGYRVGDVPPIGTPYKISIDPEDSVFYSTCYQKRDPWQFAQSCPACSPPLPRADFRFGNNCISCKDMNRNYFSNAAPFWQLSDVCEDCDPLRG